MNYYKRHLGDYAKKAGHLSMLEHGAYNLILDAYYDRENGPTREEAIRWARARSPEEVAAVQYVLSEFFTEVDGRYVQARTEEELAAFRQRQETNRQLGAKGGKAKAERVASEQLTDSASESLANGLAKSKPSHKPLAISHKEQEQELLREPAAPVPASVITILLNDGSEYPITEAHVAEFSALYPAVDVMAELRKARGWSLSSPRRRKTKFGVMRFVNGWLAKAQDEAPSANRQRAGPTMQHGKTMGAILQLEEMKRGLAETRDSDGNPKTALPWPGGAAGG